MGSCFLLLLEAPWQACNCFSPISNADVLFGALHVHRVSVGKSLRLNSKQMHLHKFGCLQQFQGSCQQRLFEVTCFHSTIKNHFGCMFQVVPWTQPAFIWSYNENTKWMIYVTAHLRQRPLSKQIDAVSQRWTDSWDPPLTNLRFFDLGNSVHMCQFLWQPALVINGTIFKKFGQQLSSAWQCYNELTDLWWHLHYIHAQIWNRWWPLTSNFNYFYRHQTQMFRKMSSLEMKMQTKHKVTQ